MIAHRGRGTAEGAALTLAGRSVIRAGFALPRDAGRRPPPGELASAPGRPSRLICWGTCRDGVIPTVGVCAAAALRAAVPTGGRRSKPGATSRERSAFPAAGRCRAPSGRTPGGRGPSVLETCSPSAVRGTHADGWASWARRFALRALMPVGDRRSSRPRRLFSVCGARHSRWRDGASSELVSRSRAMPVGDRRSSRPRACSPSVVRGTSRWWDGASSRGLFSVCGARRSSSCWQERAWQDGASSALVLGLWCAALTRVSRSRAMPVGDRRSSRSSWRALVLGLWCAALTVAGGSVIGSWFRAPARCRSEDRRSWRARHALAGWSVLGTGFALPRMPV